LGLHREKKEILSRHDHLRLCALMMVICLGRRIQEVLLSPRVTGPDGPLSRNLSRSGASEGSLWFQFKPNKEGAADKVFISPEWEDLALYCVRELVKYSDELRRWAAPEERALLILISPLNSTKGRSAKFKSHGDGQSIIVRPGIKESDDKTAGQKMALTYQVFTHWLNGSLDKAGVMSLWGITADASEDGPTYRFLTSHARHTRQSALALDPKISLLARQQDLNHGDPDVQFAYQHRLRETNDSLLEKIKEGKLLGRGAEWLSELLGVKTPLPSPQSNFSSGCSLPMTSRIQGLMRNNPLFIQQNRVPCGVCVLPHGPGGCVEFLNCTSASEGGCNFFVVDVSDSQMLYELNKKADDERRLQQESASGGRMVQAQKRAELARRTEELRDEAMRRSSEGTLAELRRLENEIQEGGL
jgi:hypothetical protein